MRDFQDVLNLAVLLSTVFHNYTFEAQKQGGGWARIFVGVKRQDGVVQTGRINFQPITDGYTLYGVKHYKPYFYEYESEDAFFYQFYTWWATTHVIDVDALVPEAKEMCHKRLDTILQWRREHPKDKRRRHTKVNWRSDLLKLIERENLKHARVNAPYVSEHEGD